MRWYSRQKLKFSQELKSQYQRIIEANSLILEMITVL